MTQTTELVSVSSMLLNPENYRHRLVTSQEECFRELIREAKDRDYLFALAMDIAARGLNPSELPILEPSGTRWRVLEGNRRIAALKAMANADVIPDNEGMTARQVAAYRKKFADLGSTAVLPDQVLCAIEPDRAASDHWVTLKHTVIGEHKGAGPIGWDATGIARHRMGVAGTSPAGGKGRAANDQSGRAVVLLDALREEFAGDSEVLGLVEKAASKGITTLGRLLIKPESRLRLGVEIENGSVRWTVTSGALRVVMMRVLGDLGTPKLNSRTVNTASEILDYLDEVQDDLPTQASRTASPRAPSTGAGAPGVSGPASATPPKKPVKREKRPATKPYGGLTLANASSKTKAVLKELQSLRFDSHPNTCVIMNRVLIDVFTQDVLEAVRTGSSTQSSSKNLMLCLRLIDSDKGVQFKDRKYPHLWSAVESHTGELSVDSMHMYVHRATHRASEDIPRIQCERYGPFLSALDDHVTAHAKNP